MNKNQARIRRALNKKGNTSGIAIQVPHHGFHNNSNGAWTTRRINPIGGKTEFKAKAKPFPSKDGMKLIDQIKFFNGQNSQLS